MGRVGAGRRRRLGSWISGGARVAGGGLLRVFLGLVDVLPSLEL